LRYKNRVLRSRVENAELSTLNSGFLTSRLNCSLTKRKK
jgi:hypothetical protein